MCNFLPQVIWCESLLFCGGNQQALKYHLKCRIKCDRVAVTKMTQIIAVCYLPILSVTDWHSLIPIPQLFSLVVLQLQLLWKFSLGSSYACMWMFSLGYSYACMWMTSGGPCKVRVKGMTWMVRLVSFSTILLQICQYLCTLIYHQ